MMYLIIKGRSIIIFFLIAVLVRCNNDELDTDISKTTSKDYSKVEIYCWCFLSNRQETETPCTTPKAVVTAELIKNENLFRTINNIDTIERLKSVIFNGKKLTEERMHQPDSRLMFLFKISDLCLG